MLKNEWSIRWDKFGAFLLSMARMKWRSWLLVLLVAAGYFILARLSLLLAFKETNASPIWPPSGVALAAVLLLGYRVCPGIFLGAFLANAVVFYANHMPDMGMIILLSAIIGVGNTLESAAGAFLVRTFIERENLFYKVKDVFKFLLIVAMSCTISATVGPVALCLFALPWDYFSTIWLTWWLGDIGGILIFTPVIFVLNKNQFAGWKMKRVLEAVSLLVVLFLVNGVVFGTKFSLTSIGFPFAYLLLPLIIWSAYRFGQLGVSISVLVTLGIAVWGTVGEFGPFAGSDQNISLLLLLSFVGFLSVTGLILSTALVQSQRAEEALRKNEQRFRSLVENSTDLIGLIDAKGNILYASNATRKVLGYEIEEYVGTNMFDYIHPNDQELIAVKLGDVIQESKKIVHDRCRYRHKDGSWLWLEGSGQNLLDDPNINAIVLNYRDITEKKRNEENIAESEARFRMLADTAPVLIWMAGTDALCNFFNKPWLEFTGRPIEQELGDGWVEGVHPDDRERCVRIYRESFQARQKFTMDYRLHRKDGKYRWILDIGVPRFVPDGSFAGYVGSCLDITERKVAEELLKRDKVSLSKLIDEQSKELTETQKKLKQASRLADIGTLAATVAHELRNPLGVIQIASYNLKKKMSFDIGDKHFINIEKKILEANQIINNLLNYSSIKIPHYETVNIGEILEECIITAQNRFQYNEVELERKTDLGVGQFIEADQVQLKEIFTNILNNAYQAFPDKKGRVGVAVELENSKYMKVMISDTGMGIDKEELHKVFEPFFTRKSKGTGLGLAICNELVHLHNGRIEIESEKGVGTTVTVVLPFTKQTINAQEDAVFS